MAKGKSAVALFEVINRGNQADKKPKPIAPVPRVQLSRKLAEQAVDLWRKKHPESEKSRKLLPNFRQMFAARLFAGRARGLAILRRVQGDARRLWNWVLRQNSIACGVAAAAVMIGSLLLARQLHHPSTAQLPVEEALRNGPAHPQVLNVARAAEAPADNAPLSPEMLADVQQAGQRVAPTDPSENSERPGSASDSNLAQPGKRVVNMHYVLMQSYFEEKTAIEARDFLIRNGVPCTIERRVKGWRADFYQVVGLQGFPRASGRAYLAYLKNIVELGKQFSPRIRYKRFTPQAIKW